MKKIILAVLFLVTWSGCAVRHTSWIGNPNIQDLHENPGWLPCIDMGLRSDGLVVWKNSTKDKCK